MEGICYLCKEPKVLTEEHIIPQCLGGFLKKRLYCAECNSEAGGDIDSALAKSFARYATLLDVKRERGNNQPFSIRDDISGIELELYDGGFRRKHPTLGKPIKDSEGNLLSIEVNARSKDELKHITRGLAKSHGLKEDSFVCESVEMAPPSGEEDLLLTGHNIDRGIAKIAYGFACIKLPSSMVLSSSFNGIRDYILGNNSAKLASLNYESTGFMTDNQRPLNKVHLSFNRLNGLVIGYVTIFGAFRYTVLVAENFASNLEWPSVDYTSDPIRKTEIACPPGFKAPTIDKHNALEPKHSKEQILNALNAGMNIIVEHSKFLERISVKAIRRDP